jgi:2-oxoglutarate ferredoxin oxidoreductase subunit gamma
MKTIKIVCAGFGGQGILTIGQLIATMAMHKGYQVSWMPSYGPEMRGGTANCHIVIDTQEVGSPIITEGITHLLAMNQPALDKFYPKLKSDAYLLVNDSLVKEFESTDQHKIERCDFASLAQEVGSPKVQNIVALGYLVKSLGIFDPKDAHAALDEKFGLKNPEMNQLNKQALDQAFNN